MRIYLIDDDSAVLSVLRLLIEDGGLRTVVGSSQSAADALEDLRTCGADIVLVDLLMPEMDGITFVQKARQQFPELHFVMLSQVTSKEMVGEAYQSGVDFFIAKPINGVEVTSVLSRVDELLTMERTMRQVRSLMQLDRPAAKPEAAASAGTAGTQTISAPQLEQLKAVLQRLGLSGDPAYPDLIQIVGYLAAQLCGRFSASPKSVEQRIRRAAAAGTSNLASLGIEDYANDVFTEYAGTLFNFEQVRKEMNCIRGKSEEHGKVSVRRFLYALAALCSEKGDQNF